MEPCKIVDRNKKCEEWLEDVASNCSEVTSGLSELSDNGSQIESGFIFTNDNVVIDGKMCIQNNTTLQLDIPFENSNKICEQINMYKCKKIHIGDVTIINNAPLMVRENINKDKETDLNIISRLHWLAQPPLEAKENLKEPAKFVIIYHTATEEGFTQAANTLLVRLIQTFHIESRKWSDIGYNFLIGSDGLIYEGRGWNVVGAHTRRFNQHSVGIAFIGCFLQHLPPNISLIMAKKLIKKGVEMGFIAKDYKLISHRQCAGVESPGQRLHEEIQTWENFDKTVNVQNAWLKIEENRVEVAANLP